MPASYRVALFVHLCALIAAVVASALAHFCSVRHARARDVRDALHWHGTAMKVTIVFPIALVVFFLSGGYMVSVSGMWSWGAGWIVDGIMGGALLFVLGGYSGARHRAFAKRLEEQARLHPSDTSPIAPDAIADTLAWASSGLAIAIVCVMTLKPALAPGLGVLIAGPVAGILVSGLARRKHTDAAIETSAVPDRV